MTDSTTIEPKSTYRTLSKELADRGAVVNISLVNGATISGVITEPQARGRITVHEGAKRTTHYVATDHIVSISVGS